MSFWVKILNVALFIVFSSRFTHNLWVKRLENTMKSATKENALNAWQGFDFYQHQFYIFSKNQWYKAYITPLVLIITYVVMEIYVWIQRTSDNIFSAVFILSETFVSPMRWNLFLKSFSSQDTNITVVPMHLLSGISFHKIFDKWQIPQNYAALCST